MLTRLLGPRWMKGVLCLGGALSHHVEGGLAEYFGNVYESSVDRPASRAVGLHVGHVQLDVACDEQLRAERLDVLREPEPAPDAGPVGLRDGLEHGVIHVVHKVITFRDYPSGLHQGGLSELERGGLSAVSQKVAERVFYLAVWAPRWGQALVLLSVPGLPDFVEYHTHRAGPLRDVCFVELEHFSAEVVLSVAVEVSLRGLDQPVTNVLLEVAVAERVVKRY